MKPDALAQIGVRLASAETVAILPHLNADGDALGAALALAIGLTSKGKIVDVLLEEPVPKMLDFLPGLGLVKPGPRPSYNIALNIDNGDLSRLGVREPVYWGAAERLSIDHHATNHVTADISHVDTHAAATGEIVFDLLARMEIPTDKEIAMCLYTAILTDTGGFRFTNTTPRTHRIAADLMEFGIDCGYAAKRVFDTISMIKLQLMKQAMNHLKVYEDGLLAVSFLSRADIQAAGGSPGDFEGMVNIGRNLEGLRFPSSFGKRKPGISRAACAPTTASTSRKSRKPFRAAGISVPPDSAWTAIWSRYWIRCGTALWRISGHAAGKADSEWMASSM